MSLVRGGACALVEPPVRLTATSARAASDRIGEHVQIQVTCINYVQSMYQKDQLKLSLRPHSEYTSAFLQGN